MAEKTAPVAQRGRVKRTPINGRNILNVTGKEPGYEYRFVNDVGDRVAISKNVAGKLSILLT